MSNLENKYQELDQSDARQERIFNDSPPLDLLLGEIFSDQREQGEDREGLCEQLLHQGDELRSCST